jgi:hypothetical protein
MGATAHRDSASGRAAAPLAEALADHVAGAADLTSIVPVSRMNSPVAGVIEVYARAELKSSTCTIVLPMCSCQERSTRSARHGSSPSGYTCLLLARYPQPR